MGQSPSRLIQAIISQAEMLRPLGDAALAEQGRALRWRAKTGEKLDRLLVPAYALVREAARRALGMEHFPVQMRGAIAIFQGGIAEMQTGEGKTLTAVMPAFLRALPGQGCHVITVNDYLTARDAARMGKIYNLLGMTVGCVTAEMEPPERRVAYASDVTYGTAKELGFDFLRDRIKLGAAGATPVPRHRLPGTSGVGADPPVQRGHYFALIDEADSVLIDEARTPLIIGLQQMNTAAVVQLYRWCQHLSCQLKLDEEFEFDPSRRTAILTDAGCRRVLLAAKPSGLDGFRMEELYNRMEQALAARYGYALNRDYVVSRGEIAIVDESTGRIMEGRKWQDGLHQSLEAKESLSITPATGEAARVTVQSFFRQYAHLAGMTGTALTARRELRKIYGLRVTKIPTHRPPRRRAWPPRVFATLAAKRAAVAEEVKELLQQGRSVLVGTPSVEASAALGKLLNEQGIDHRILNAVLHAEEAEIVSRAGQPGAVTIATNMAGRGTDIELEASVRAAGGLHVIATEMHSSTRIDRQLVGRSARLGDPGSYRFFLSLEDELLDVLEPKVIQRARRRAGPGRHGELSPRWISVFIRTQNQLESRYAKQRHSLVRQEQQRFRTMEEMGLDPFLELG